MISSLGVGTGLDINSLIQQLISAEGDAKTTALINKRSNVENKISAFGQLKSTLSSFQSAIQSLKDPDTFDASKVTSGNTDLFTASVSGAVTKNTYQVEVETLAEAHRLITTGFTDSDTVVGTGILTIDVGGASFNLSIDSNNDTLGEIRDAINDATDNTGVTASIVNVDDGIGGTVAKLILTSNETGTANKITVTVDDDDLNDTDTSGLSALVYDPDGTGTTNATEANAAVDSVIYIDGQKVTGSSNTVTGALENVTINLLDASPGVTFDLKIELDTSQVSSAVKSMVDNFNILANLINSLSSYDAETRTAGILLGDSTLRSLNTRIRQEMSATVSGLTGDITNVISLGITTNDNGTLSFDSSKLSDAMEDNLDNVAEIFSSENGVANKLDDLLEGFLQSNGVIDGKTDGLNDTLEDINESLTALDSRLKKMEERLVAQFSALDSLVSQLNSTSDYLTNALASVPTPGKSKS